MHTTINRNHLSFITRTAAVAFLAAGASVCLQAQQTLSTAQSYPKLDLRAVLNAPLDLSRPESLSYSSSVGVDETASAEDFDLRGGEENQPPPRRPYSHRTNYNDSTHNADGSNKYTFIVGGGFTLPVGGTHNDLTTSYAFQAGGGRNFNKKLGVLLEFNWANFGIRTETLNNVLAIYNSLGANLNQLNGSSHVWSFSIDPVYNLAQGDRSGMYVTGGVGFYHKTADFTIPAIGITCDIFGNCFQFQANQTIDSYTSNAFGANLGFGYTYRFSRFADERFYVEARYVYNANSRRPETGTTPENTPPGSTAFNAFPQNSAPTTFIPITFGVRF
jgi:opacity protein-like surface antigen